MGLDHRIAQSRDVVIEVECPFSRGGLRSAAARVVRGVESGLGLGGASLHAAAKPRELGPREIASNLFGRCRVLLTFGLGLEELGVATRVDVGLASVDLDHARRDLIEEEAVVAH